MDVMILGAGRGTRLAGLQLLVPKILVDVGGEPLLARQLRYLAGQGAVRAVVNTHHLAEQVQAFAAQHTGLPELVVVSEAELLGTAGGVRNALAHFGSGPIVVLYGDVLTDTPLAPLLAAHRDSGAVATLTVYASDETEDKGTVEVDPSGRVSSFREKGGRDQGPALINAGLYVVNPGFVAEAVAPGETSDFGHDVFPAALAGGLMLMVYRLPKPVLDVGTPEKLLEAQPSGRGLAS